MVLVDVATLREYSQRALERLGVPNEHASLQCDLLLEAELRGVPSHGLLRLERIVTRISNGVIDPSAVGCHTWRELAFLDVDGKSGLGPVIASRALDALAVKAREIGIAVGAISNANHLGMLAWYAERMADQGFTVLGWTISEALVHPWDGRHAMIGTNPVTIGLPVGDGFFVMDAATSIVSMGKIHDHAQRGASIPPDWALDAAGNPTTDADAAKSGALAPFGGPKGYALGLAFELLVASLTGAALGRDVRGTLDDVDVCNKGDVFIVIKGPCRDLQTYLAQIRETPPAEGFESVLIPGERGRACRQQRLRDGVPVSDSVWSRLQEMAGAASVG